MSKLVTRKTGSAQPSTAQPPRPPVAAEMLTSGRAVWGRYLLGMCCLALVTALFSQDAYWLGLITLGLLFAGLASAWNIIGGFGGQFSLGHGVFFAVGAYAVALLQTRFGWSPWLGIAVGVALTMLIALLLSWPVFRLHGPFFAIGTLALNEVALALANYFEWTGGPHGVRIPFTDAAVTDQAVWPWIMFGYAAAVIAVTLFLTRTRLGYYLVAVRDGEIAASAAGANPLAVKTLGLLLSAALTAIGGGLFATYIGFIDPHSVLAIADVGARIPLLALIGGLGTVTGPVIGALLIQPAEMYLRGELSWAPPGFSLIALGLLFVLAARFFKQGIWGAASKAWKKVLHGRD